MANGVEARSEYGGLFLNCDDEAFVRLQALICSEPSVADALRGLPDRLGLRFISVRHPPVEKADDSRGPGWLTLVPTIVVSAISCVALIVGYVTIARWLMRLIA